MSSEMKNCPICKLKVKLESTSYRYDFCGIEYTICCEKCGLSMYGCGDNPYQEDTPELDALIKKWNDRDFK